MEARLVARYLTAPGDVLVIASGNGREARPLVAGGHRIVCVDLGPDYLSIGRTLFAREGTTSVRFAAADMYHLPFAPRSFDFIFCSTYSRAAERRFDLLRHVARLLRPGGHVLLLGVTPVARSFALGPEEAYIESDEQFRAEVSGCGLEYLESGIGADAPDYRLAIARRP